MSEREERDSMGGVSVPEEAYFGAQTQRAVENYPVSGLTFPSVFIRTLGLVKKCAAAVDQKSSCSTARLAQAIRQAAQEVAEGKLDRHFPLDIFQTGSGTSTNMNANEVIAGRANEILGGRRGRQISGSPQRSRQSLRVQQRRHPLGDPYPHMGRSKTSSFLRFTVLHQSSHREITGIRDIWKVGRTTYDALPMRLGQEFGGYARQVEWV